MLKSPIAPTASIDLPNADLPDRTKPQSQADLYRGSRSPLPHNPTPKTTKPATQSGLYKMDATGLEPVTPTMST